MSQLIAHSDAARLLTAHPQVRSTGHPVASADAAIVDGKQAIPIELRTEQAPGSLNAPVVVDGRGVLEAGEVLLDAGLADANGIELGDTVTVRGASRVGDVDRRRHGVRLHGLPVSEL